MFKIKDGYRLELQTPETLKLFGSTKDWIDKTKNGENVPSIEVVEVALVQCNSVHNHYQQKFKSLYTFTANKSSADSLNVEPNNLVFLNTCNTEFNIVIITFNDQNDRPLEDKVTLTLLINK